MKKHVMSLSSSGILAKARRLQLAEASFRDMFYIYICVCVSVCVCVIYYMLLSVIVCVCVHNVRVIAGPNISQPLIFHCPKYPQQLFQIFQTKALVQKLRHVAQTRELGDNVPLALHGFEDLPRQRHVTAMEAACQWETGCLRFCFGSGGWSIKNVSRLKALVPSTTDHRNPHPKMPGKQADMVL